MEMSNDYARIICAANPGQIWPACANCLISQMSGTIRYRVQCCLCSEMNVDTSCKSRVTMVYLRKYLQQKKIRHHQSLTT